MIPKTKSEVRSLRKISNPVPAEPAERQRIGNGQIHVVGRFTARNIDRDGRNSHPDHGVGALGASSQDGGRPRGLLDHTRG